MKLVDPETAAGAESTKAQNQSKKQQRLNL